MDMCSGCSGISDLAGSETKTCNQPTVRLK